MPGARGFERISQRECGRIAIGWTLCKAAHDHALECRWNLTLGRGLRRRHRHPHAVLVKYRECRVPLERHGARDHLVQDHPERVDVGPCVHRVAEGLLGGHVVRRSDDDTGRRERDLLLRQFRDAEVEDLDPKLAVPIRGEKQVRRLEVAVNDRAFMCLGEAGARLYRDLDGSGGVDAIPIEAGFQRFAFEPFECQVHPPITRVTEIAALDQVRMTEVARQLSFSLKTLDRGDVRSEIGTKNLDGHASLDVDLLGFVHDAHGPRPDLSQEPIALVEQISSPDLREEARTIPWTERGRLERSAARWTARHKRRVHAVETDEKSVRLRYLAATSAVRASRGQSPPRTARESASAACGERPASATSAGGSRGPS